MKKLAIIILCVILLSASLFGCDKAEERKEDISDSISNTTSKAPLEQSEEVSEGVSVEVSEHTFTIVDKRDTAAFFDDGEENIYFDEEYRYSLPATPESEYIIVEYSDGTKENIKEALENGNITIEDLDRFGIKYLKYSKSTGDLVE